MFYQMQENVSYNITFSRNIVEKIAFYFLKLHSIKISIIQSTSYNDDIFFK